MLTQVQVPTTRPAAQAPPPQYAGEERPETTNRMVRGGGGDELQGKYSRAVRLHQFRVEQIVLFLIVE